MKYLKPILGFRRSSYMYIGSLARVSYRGGAWDLPPPQDFENYDVVKQGIMAVGRYTQWTLTIYYHVNMLWF